MTPAPRPRSKRARLGLVAAIVLGLAAPLVALAAVRGSSQTAAAPSFTRDVAPIIESKCAGCHQPGGVAPFAFDSAESVSSRSSLIAAAVETGVMPPWPPGPSSPEYVGQAKRTLTASQRSTILEWARAGGATDGPLGEPAPSVGAQAREGERVLDIAMPTTYTPRAQPGTTDDYRCFVLDPKLAGDVSVTSARIEPGAAKVVHHVILFRTAANQASEAARLDASERGPGWTCFGGTGVADGSLNDASWIAAWAPGGEGGRLPDGTGVPLEAGTKIVMQAHYNLLNGSEPDRSRAVLTTVPASAGLDDVRTMLLPAPVELECADAETGPLCDRSAARDDLGRKYGLGASFVPDGLLLLCGRSARDIEASPVSSCDRRIRERTRILVAAGHMHTLGTSIRIELNPETSRARTLLDIPRWDFHWQGAYVLEEAIEAEPGDVVRVTCRHDVSRRQHADHGGPQTPRYILWGEGTTDEMCLGLLQVVGE